MTERIEMNFAIDAKKILERNLASSMGLDEYRFIMEQVRKVDVSKNREFQKAFDYYYKVRRGEEWRKTYFNLFEKSKAGTACFSDILTELYEKTCRVEASFSSKLLASINENQPIWDQNVLNNLGLRLTSVNGQKRLREAIEIYSEIEKWYQKFLPSDNARECLEIFDDFLPDYRWISDVKKIDCLLWSWRDK